MPGQAPPPVATPRGPRTRERTVARPGRRADHEPASRRWQQRTQADQAHRPRLVEDEEAVAAAADYREAPSAAQQNRYEPGGGVMSKGNKGTS